MKKRFNRVTAFGLAILLAACNMAAHAENAGDRAGQDDGVFRYRENGAEENVDVTMIEEGQSPGRFTYQVACHDEKIKYCVPSARMGSISVIQSPAAEMKLAAAYGRQECRIYFYGDFKLVYEPYIGNGTRIIGDEIQLDFYLENGQWICKKTVTAAGGFNLPPDNRGIGGWRELGLALHETGNDLAYAILSPASPDSSFLKRSLLREPSGEAPLAS